MGNSRFTPDLTHNPSNETLNPAFTSAIDLHEGDKIDEAAFKDLIRAAVALNLKGHKKLKPRPQRATGKRNG